MIVGVCGFISTGSSAVSDYLKEYDTVSAVDSLEFVLPYFPDGLEDLDFHLNTACSKYMSSTIAFERFRRHMKNFFIMKRNLTKAQKKAIADATDRYLSSIIQVTYQGYGRADYQVQTNLRNLWFRGMRSTVVKRLEKMFKGKDVDHFLYHKMEYAVCPEKFDELTRAFVQEILQIHGADLSKMLVLDQPFNGNDPVRSFKYFDDPIAIVVDRDPRDQYVFAKKFLRNKGRSIPTDTVEHYVEFYKRMRQGQPYTLPHERVMVLHFEDMVYRYEETTAKLKEFLQLDESKRSRTLFVPEMSKNNTQVFKRYPELAADIAYIEKELPEYLFPFEQYGDVTPTGKMFYGCSPLNKR